MRTGVQPPPPPREGTKEEAVDAEEPMKKDNPKNQGGGKSSTGVEEEWKKTKKNVWEAMKKRREERAAARVKEENQAPQERAVHGQRQEQSETSTVIMENPVRKRVNNRYFRFSEYVLEELEKAALDEYTENYNVRMKKPQGSVGKADGTVEICGWCGGIPVTKLEMRLLEYYGVDGKRTASLTPSRWMVKNPYHEGRIVVRWTEGFKR